MKLLKRITVLLLVLCMLTQGVYAQTDGAAVVVGEKTVEAGKQVSVPIMLENNSGLASAKIKVTFDESVLTLVEVQDTGLLPGQTHRPDLNNPYPLSWSNDLATANITANGTIAMLVFQVAEDAAEGTYPIYVDCEEILDCNMKNVHFAAVNGAVTVGKQEPTKVEQLEYETDGEEMIITGYNGSETEVIIGGTYEVNGTEYQVTEIADEAFSGSEVTSVELADSIVTIGNSAFEGCESLKKLVIPSSVESVGESAFYDCTELTHVVVLGEDTEILDAALGLYYVKRKVDGVVDGLLIEGHAGSTAEEYARALEEEYGVEIFKPLLRLDSTSVTLTDKLSLNYKVNKEVFDEYGYSNPRVEITMNGETYVQNWEESKNGKAVFPFNNISPDQMNDTLTATVYATYNGEEKASAVDEYSVAEYCYSQLEAYKSDKELSKLLVNMLNYGAAAQLYNGYKPTELANAKLTDEQQAMVNEPAKLESTDLDTKNKVVDAPKATWKGAGLVLDQAVTLRLKFAAQSVSGLSVKITSESGQSWNLTKFVPGDGVYYVYFNGLHAGQMREKLYMTIYEGDTAVSNTVCYSIASYAYEKQNSGVSGLADLVKAMMKYGDSASMYSI